MRNLNPADINDWRLVDVPAVTSITDHIASAQSFTTYKNDYLKHLAILARRKRHTVYSMDTPDPHRFRDGMGAEAFCVTLGVEPTPIK